MERALGDEGGLETTSSTDMANIPNLTLAIPASVGDVLDITLDIVWFAGTGVNARFNIAVDGTDRHPSSNGWVATSPVNNGSLPATFTLTHTVEAGDITAGEVTVAGRFASHAGSAINVSNDGNDGTPTLTVKNLGAVG